MPSPSAPDGHNREGALLAYVSFIFTDVTETVGKWVVRFAVIPAIAYEPAGLVRVPHI